MSLCCGIFNSKFAIKVLKTCANQLYVFLLKLLNFENFTLANACGSSLKEFGKKGIFCLFFFEPFRHKKSEFKIRKFNYTINFNVLPVFLFKKKS